MANLTLQQVNYEDAPALESFADHTIYQTRQWLQFLAKMHHAEPVIAVVKDGADVVGRFSGFILRKFGLRILGSPFPGCGTTGCMGFNLRPSVVPTDALLALEKFAFHDLRCIHLEIMDQRLTIADAQKLGVNYKVQTFQEIDLTKSEEELLAGMRKSTRRSIRDAAKKGIQIEEANDLSFVDDYYAQVVDVFAKQRLRPHYPKELVRTLVEYLLPTGQLLLVRARDAQGTCIATGIYPAMNDIMFGWGSASFRSYQHLHPNEPVKWFAMRYWKAKGIARHDMGGAMEYKKKYGPYEVSVPWVRKSVHPIFEYVRNAAKKLITFKQHFYGLRKH